MNQPYIENGSTGTKKKSKVIMSSRRPEAGLSSVKLTAFVCVDACKL